MKRYDLLTTCLLTFALVLPTACSDDGGEETTTENAEEETTENNMETTEETGPDMEITCAIYCVTYIESDCLGTEFETNDQCQMACEAMTPEGRECRYEQINMGNCAEAGTMGTTCE